MKTKFKYIYLSLFLIFFINCSEDKISSTGKGAITGKVVSVGYNAPMEDVKISTNPSSSIVFSDAFGEFVLLDVVIGDYSIQADKTGYLTKFEGITVIDEGTVNVIFEMDIETANNRAPDTPILITPTDNSINLEVEVELTWSGTDQDEDELTYSIEVLNDQNSEVLEFANLADTTYIVSSLNYGTKYFWQVAASDGINEPTRSAVYSFETLPFTDNRFFFVRNVSGNNVIFSGDEDGNEIQLTSSSANSWRPRKANSINKIAFLRTNGGNTHLYTMNLDGSDVFQVTNNVPVAGFNNEELDIAWRNNDTRLLYPSFDKLYRIAPSGSALQQLHQTLDGNFISEIDWDSTATRIALKTNNSSGYNVNIYTINTSGAIQDVVLENVTGAAGGLDYSFDGTKLLYTYDTSGNENGQYRQLDTEMFLYNFNTSSIMNISDGKPSGTNDLDPRFSPNESQIIFVNTSNDGVSQKDIYIIDINSGASREPIYLNAKMPDWK